jgi:ubiquinone/menaquinone biosynthesis C-methylase UbiE
MNTKRYKTNANPIATKVSAKVATSWDPVADWYDGWVGPNGSLYHRKVAIPALLPLLDLQSGQQLLDIGAGQGVLAPYVVAAQAHYTGIDASRRLLRRAEAHHGRHQNVRFLHGDARHLHTIGSLAAGSFDTAVFLLSIQDMDPLAEVLASATWALKTNGRLVILMTHPCFRIPRQSGWGYDPNRKLRYRRVDRYLTPLPVPMKAYDGAETGVTRSFHRPLQAYINGLVTAGCLVEQMREIPVRAVLGASKNNRAEQLANAEIPLFLALRGSKI